MPPTPTPTPIPLVDITPQEVRRVNTDGTDYQWAQLKEEMIGKRIVWHGQVYRVSEDRRLHVGFPGTSIVIDAGVIGEAEAANLMKGQPVTIEARVLRVRRLLGVAVINVQMLELRD